MITLVRNIAADLVEKRLWPVAVALVAALVAVPIVLGSGGESPTRSATPAAPSTPRATLAEVTLDTAAPTARDRDGRLRDPFKAPAGATTTTTTETAPAPAQASPGSGSSAGSSAGASTSTSFSTPASTAPSAAASTGSRSSSSASTFSPGSTSAPSGSTPSGSDSGSSTGKKTTTTSKTKTTKPKTAKPKADDASDTYHVSLRFGVNGGELKTQRDVARLSALPSVTDPFFVYLGVLETQKTHEKRAVFMVSSDAVPTGEAVCKPTNEDCETVEMTVGQTMYFDYTAPNGQVTQYQLELAGIHKTEIRSEAKAQAAIARHSNVGAELLRDAAVRNADAAAGARSYRYLPGAGMLVRAKVAAEARAASSAEAATAGGTTALRPRGRQPGIPVWRSPSKRR